jgi:hypothetical protein
VLKQIHDIEEWQLTFLTPRNFDYEDQGNDVKGIELSFEHLCTAMEEMGVHNPGELPLFQFISKINYFKKKNKPKSQTDY